MSRLPLALRFYSTIELSTEINFRDIFPSLEMGGKGEMWGNWRGEMRWREGDGDGDSKGDLG
jgi:hypothetical protein